MKKKNIIYAGVVLILAIVVAGGFWVWKSNQRVEVIEEQGQQQEEDQQTEIDTSDWQTYRNEEYGFEFEYPKDWSFADKKGGGVNFFKIGKEYILEEGRTYSISLSFNFDNYEGKKSLEEWKKSSEDIGIGEPKVEDLIIDGKKTVRMEHYLGISTLILYNEPNNDQIYITAQYFGDKEIDSENLIVYDNIIKTFKFFK